jgi:hypothetical protein
MIPSSAFTNAFRMQAALSRGEKRSGARSERTNGPALRQHRVQFYLRRRWRPWLDERKRRGGLGDGFWVTSYLGCVPTSSHNGERRGTNEVGGEEDIIIEGGSTSLALGGWWRGAPSCAFSDMLTGLTGCERARAASSDYASQPT